MRLTVLVGWGALPRMALPWNRHRDSEVKKGCTSHRSGR